MNSTRSDQAKSEEYARALIEAAREQGRANKDLAEWNNALKFSPEVLDTLATMRGEGDLDLVDDVARTYKEILDSEENTVSVTVTTAVPLDDELRETIRAKAEKDLESPVYLVEHVDPAIIGGVVLEVRGHRYDASVRAQLASIRKTLSSTFMGSDD